MTKMEPLPRLLKSVESSLINERAEALMKERKLKRPDLKRALAEVVDGLIEEVGDILDESRNLVVYQPSGEEDEPYVFAIPVTQLPEQPVKKIHEHISAIRDDFENVIFETEPGLNPRDLDKDEKDHYINSRVKLLWHGFNLYHQKLMIARTNKERVNHLKALGKYVVCKVTPNGVCVFVNQPQRYKTKAQAYERSRELQHENGGGWGILRILDVITPDDYVNQEDNNE